MKKQPQVQFTKGSIFEGYTGLQWGGYTPFLLGYKIQVDLIALWSSINQYLLLIHQIFLQYRLY